MEAKYKAGDHVRYAASGVCRVEEIKRMAVSARTDERDYYVLRPIDNSTLGIYVPVDNQAMVGNMIPVLTREEIDGIVRLAHKEALPWTEDRKERSESHREILRRCDRRELLRLISCIYLRRQELAEKGRKLSATDEATLRQAERSINNELAFVLEIEESQVSGYIRGLLEG